MEGSSLFDKVYGCLLGGLIGDAMGAPVEGWNYAEIEKKHGEVNDFDGEGTDDSAIRRILMEAIFEHQGYVSADEFAASFLRHPQYTRLFYIPVLNMYHKIKDELVLPVYAGMGNMQSSSSAMCIAPMGIINACNPRQAALETYDVAGLIHGGESSSFCRDGACAIAAAVAEAMSPESTVESVLAASTAFLHPKSAALMIDRIGSTLEMASQAGEYRAFRSKFYEISLQSIISDSRETVPAVLAIFSLVRGDPVRAILYGANFGRDADTIGTMVGGIAGAFRGVAGLKPEWVAKIEQKNSVQKELADRLVKITRRKAAQTEQMNGLLKALA
jgi:ADP-ribosylglycohydrolase